MCVLGLGLSLMGSGGPQAGWLFFGAAFRPFVGSRVGSVLSQTPRLAASGWREGCRQLFDRLFAGGPSPIFCWGAARLLRMPRLAGFHLGVWAPILLSPSFRRFLSAELGCADSFFLAGLSWPFPSAPRPPLALVALASRFVSGLGCVIWRVEF